MPARITYQYELRRIEELLRHKKALRDFGFDPDFIGVTEVEPVRCEAPLCREPLPWRIVRGWGTPACCTRCGQNVPLSTLRRWQD